MYRPPPTDAQYFNPAAGKMMPVPPGSYNYFSSAEDDAAMLPLMKACDPNVQVTDAGPLGLLMPPVTYGSDGRKITLYSGTDPVTGLPYEATVGQLLQAKNYGPMYNGNRQPPYVKLFIDGIAYDTAGGTPGAVEVHWGS